MERKDNAAAIRPGGRNDILIKQQQQQCGNIRIFGHQIADDTRHINQTAAATAWKLPTTHDILIEQQQQQRGNIRRSKCTNVSREANLVTSSMAGYNLNVDGQGAKRKAVQNRYHPYVDDIHGNNDAKVIRMYHASPISLPRRWHRYPRRNLNVDGVRKERLCGGGSSDAAWQRRVLLMAPAVERKDHATAATSDKMGYGLMMYYSCFVTASSGSSADAAMARRGWEEDTAATTWVNVSGDGIDVVIS